MRAPFKATVVGSTKTFSSSASARTLTFGNETPIQPPRPSTQGKAIHLAVPSVRSIVYKRACKKLWEQMKKGEKLRKKSQFQLSKMGRIESDRRIPSEMPKHLNSGKRGMGKTDRR